MKLKDIVGKKYAVRVKSKLILRRLLEAAIEQFNASVNFSAWDKYWEDYKDDKFCVEIDNIGGTGNPMFGSEDYFKGEKYTIIDFSALEDLNKSKEVKFNELKMEEVYTVTVPEVKSGDGYYQFLFQFGGHIPGREDGVNALYLISDITGKDPKLTRNTQPVLKNRKTRKATKEEKQWLELCIREGKVVPRPTNNNEMSQKENNGRPKSAAETAQEAILELLGGPRKGVVFRANVELHDTPPTISIPKTMSKMEASEELRRQWEEEETVIDIARSFEGWKWQDVLVAVKLTAEDYFGWVNAQQSFMNPPTEIEIITDYKGGLPVKTTCFFGEFKVTALEGALCNIGVSAGRAVLSFNAKKKYKKQIQDWYDLVDKHLRAKSIYKGKSVAVTFGNSRFGDPVEFEIVETKPNSKIVLNPKEESIMKTYCTLDLKEKGKRTYLFTGPYGNAKTESAMRLGEEAKALDMVFFYCKDASGFTDLLRIAAKNYSPCFIFMEDIDEVGSGEDRNEQINTLLNTLDGAETKGKDIKVLFTTNHHNRINPALRRPGRLDLIVRFENPTEETREKIYRVYLQGLENLEPLDYRKIASETPDCSGAFVAEICKRASRLGELNNGLNNEIVISAIDSIRDHLDLMSEAVENEDELKKAIGIISKEMFGSVISIDSKQIAQGVSQNIAGQISTVHADLSKKVKLVGDKLVETDEKVEEIHEATV